MHFHEGRIAALPVFALTSPSNAIPRGPTIRPLCISIGPPLGFGRLFICHDHFAEDRSAMSIASSNPMGEGKHGASAYVPSAHIGLTREQGFAAAKWPAEKCQGSSLVGGGREEAVLRGRTQRRLPWIL